MYKELENINKRPAVFSQYTAETLWNDPHISKKMLEYHLSQETELASRKRDFISRAVDWMSQRFDITAGRRVADIGCGPGLYAAGFAKKGADVTGVDFSENSIRYATEQAAAENLKINYVRGNYLDYKPAEKFDLIAMIYFDFCPLNPQQRSAMLKMFRENLTDGGAVIMDVVSLAGFALREESASYARRLMDGFWSANDYYGFMNTFKFDAEKVVLDKYTIVEKARTWEVYNWMQYFSRDSLSREFADNGLRIEEYYKNVAGDAYDENAPEFAVVARKSIDHTGSVK